MLATEWTPGDVTASGYAYVVKRVARGRPLSEAVELYRGQKSDVATAPSVLHDGQGRSLTLIVQALDFFHSRTLVLGKDGKPRELKIPQKVSVAGLVAGQVVFSLDEAWGTCLPAPSQRRLSTT
ncbi:hypothetical protein [Novosphingobium panipatense]|uniref:hypothetical protein n=1 Tax=Novosphingobium panipatense TaxID=428991 RepID=UPI00361F56FE